MPTICMTLATADLTRAVTALSARWGYPPFLPDGITPNPQTRGEFVRQYIGQWVRSEVKAHELATAQAAVTVTDIAVT